MKTSFYTASKQTDIVLYNSFKEVFNNLGKEYKDKLIPLLSVGLNQINSKFPNIRIHFIHHSVGVDKTVYQINAGKYDFISVEGKLKPVEDLELSNLKTKYLTSDIEPEYDNIVWFYYNSEGYVEKYIAPSFGTYHLFEWEKTAFGVLLKSETKYIDALNCIDCKHEYFYDDQGFPKESTTTKFAKQYQLKEHFKYEKNKKGIIKITKDTNPEWFLELSKNKSDEYQLNTSWNAGVRFQKNATEEKVLKQIISFSNIAIYSESEIDKQHASNLNRFEKEDKRLVIPEISETGELLSILYDFSAESEQIEQLAFELEEKDNQLFIVKMKIDGDYYYKYDFRPYQNGFKLDVFYYDGDEGIEKWDFSRHHFVVADSIQEAITRSSIFEKLVYQNNYLFVKKDHYETEWSTDKYKKTSVRIYHTNAAGELEKVEHKNQKGPSREIEIDSSLPIQWLQQDATPLDDAGKPLRYIGRLTSPTIFGNYYLFWELKTKQIVQIFQCT